MSKLRALPNSASSFPYGINVYGQITGESQNGLVDPLTEFPEADAVLWQEGRVMNLGTLGGNQSVPFGINDHGQVVRGALNKIHDPFANNFGLRFPLRTRGNRGACVSMAGWRDARSTHSGWPR